MNPNQDHPLDAAIRAQHEAALESISPRIRAQLAQRRVAALRDQGARRTHGLRYAAAGFAALGALAIGLQFAHMPRPTASAPATDVASPTTPVATMLDEDPEFYAWLASPDAERLALE